MLKNYLYIALQEIRKMPVLSAIKILSLAIGLACSILVIMHVQYSYSHDKHFDNWENTYRLVSAFGVEQRMNTELSADPWGPQLKLDYPQIEYLARIRGGTALLARDELAYNEDYFWAEPDIIPILGLEFVAGDPATALDTPYSIIISESIAEKYFAGEDPIGQTLTADQQINVNVAGVFRDLPENTHIRPTIIAGINTARQILGEDFMAGNFWFSFVGTRTYLTLSSQADAEILANDLEDFLYRNIPENTLNAARNAQLAIYLENIGDIYFSEFVGFGGTNPRPKIMLGLAIFAGLILLTSCINFANLSLSQIQQRGKEIGIRKTLGAKRGSIITQFLIESVFMTFLALGIALPVVTVCIPVYTNLTNTGFTAADLLASDQVVILLLFVLLTGLVSGLLPAAMLSKFQPATIIKGAVGHSKLGRLARPAVTLVQFGFSTALIILAIAISLQIRHLNTMDIGFNRDNLVQLNLNLNTLEEDGNILPLVTEIRQGPGIVAAAMAQARPPNVGALNPWNLPGAPEEDRLAIRHFPVDDHYIETMQLRLLAGRGFSQDFPGDFETGQDRDLPVDERPERGVVITRAQIANAGFASPEAALGQILELFGSRYRVIGVVDDFRFSGGLEDPFQSTGVLRGRLDPMQNLLIRIDPQQSQRALDWIDQAWERHRPGVPIERTFYEQVYNDLIDSQTGGINLAATFASIITALISAFGLYALAFYASQKRTKEVGVRKVLGATSNRIIGLLTWDFVKPVLAACVLAWGLGWYAITRYFEQFSSRVDIPVMVYGLVTVGTLGVAVLTVAFQCYRAAHADPVASLRYE